MIETEEKRNFNLLIIVTFFTGILLIVSSYAWFYASLDVKIDFFKMKVSSETGLFISLDGIDFGSTVEISEENLIRNLKQTYPGNTSQWPSRGLYGSSTNGISNTNNYKFDMFTSSKYGYKEDDPTNKKYLSVVKFEEDKINSTSPYIAFDIFLKNVSGSPKSDNLYLMNGTSITHKDAESTDEDGTINAMRIGLVKIGSVSLKADVDTIQNIVCNGACSMIIYEPNSLNHSEGSIERAREINVNLVDGYYSPTYAIIREGKNLEPENGQNGSGVPLDTEHFALQNTTTVLGRPIFQIPNAITKFRVYVWLEGQDMDNLATQSVRASVDININLHKDLAGYY